MSPFAALTRIARRRAPVDTSVRCELCSAPVAVSHGHVVALERRALLCACQACALLFHEPAAANGRFLTVPDRVLVDPGFSLEPSQWAELGIPVGLAFLFRNSLLDRWLLFYPSPAGALEGELDREAWAKVEDGSPLVRGLRSDVEALLLRRTRDGQTRSFGVPVSACYELVGAVRRHWEGFDGGDTARAVIDAFFDGLGQRSRPFVTRG